MLPKLIALDLDDTVLDLNGRLSSGNRQALQKVAQQGSQVVVATGRPLSTIPQEILEFPWIRYAITGNGAAIYDLQTKTLLLRRTIPGKAVEQILELTQNEPIAYEAFVEGLAYAQADYVRDPSPYLAAPGHIAYVQATRKPVEDFHAFMNLHRDQLDSLDLMVRDAPSRERMMALLETVAGIYVTSSDPAMVEISHQDCGKHRALAFLADRLGILQEETAAFGNADNDAEMLAWAGTGIAVQNASETCRQAADHITGFSWEDGVAKACHTVFGID